MRKPFKPFQLSSFPRTVSPAECLSLLGFASALWLY